MAPEVEEIRDEEYAARFKSRETEIRACLNKDPIDVRQLCSLLGCGDNYDGRTCNGNYEYFLAWLHENGVIEMRTYLELE